MKDLEKVLSSLEKGKRNFLNKIKVSIKRNNKDNVFYFDSICFKNSNKILDISDRSTLIDLDNTIRYLINETKERAYSSLPQAILLYKAINLADDIQFKIIENYGPCFTEKEPLYVYMLLQLSKVLLSESLKYDLEEQIIYLDRIQLEEVLYRTSRDISNLDSYIKKIKSVFAFITTKDKDFIIKQKEPDEYQELKIRREILNILKILKIKYGISYEGKFNRERDVILFKKDIF